MSNGKLNPSPILGKGYEGHELDQLTRMELMLKAIRDDFIQFSTRLGKVEHAFNMDIRSKERNEFLQLAYSDAIEELANYKIKIKQEKKNVRAKKRASKRRKKPQLPKLERKRASGRAKGD
jgi:hypothetical protein